MWPPSQFGWEIMGDVEGLVGVGCEESEEEHCLINTASSDPFGHCLARLARERRRRWQRRRRRARAIRNRFLEDLRRVVHRCQWRFGQRSDCKLGGLPCLVCLRAVQRMMGLRECSPGTPACLPVRALIERNGAGALLPRVYNGQKNGVHNGYL